MIPHALFDSVSNLHLPHQQLLIFLSKNTDVTTHPSAAPSTTLRETMRIRPLSNRAGTSNISDTAPLIIQPSSPSLSLNAHHVNNAKTPLTVAPLGLRTVQLLSSTTANAHLKAAESASAVKVIHDDDTTPTTASKAPSPSLDLATPPTVSSVNVGAAQSEVTGGNDGDARFDAITNTAARSAPTRDEGNQSAGALDIEKHPISTKDDANVNGGLEPANEAAKQSPEGRDPIAVVPGSIGHSPKESGIGIATVDESIVTVDGKSKPGEISETIIQASKEVDTEPATDSNCVSATGAANTVSTTFGSGGVLAEEPSATADKSVGVSETRDEGNVGADTEMEIDSEPSSTDGVVDTASTSSGSGKTAAVEPSAPASKSVGVAETTDQASKKADTEMATDGERTSATGAVNTTSAAFGNGKAVADEPSATTDNSIGPSESTDQANIEADVEMEIDGEPTSTHGAVDTSSTASGSGKEIGDKPLTTGSVKGKSVDDSDLSTQASIGVVVAQSPSAAGAINTATTASGSVDRSNEGTIAGTDQDSATVECNNVPDNTSGDLTVASGETPSGTSVVQQASTTIGVDKPVVASGSRVLIDQVGTEASTESRSASGSVDASVTASASGQNSKEVAGVGELTSKEHVDDVAAGKETPKASTSGDGDTGAAGDVAQNQAVERTDANDASTTTTAAEQPAQGTQRITRQQKKPVTYIADPEPLVPPPKKPRKPYGKGKAKESTPPQSDDELEDDTETSPKSLPPVNNARKIGNPLSFPQSKNEKWNNHKIPISSVFGKAGPNVPPDLESFRQSPPSTGNPNPFHIDDALLDKAHRDVIELPKKSRIYLRLHTWREYTPRVDPITPSKREHPHLERISKLLSFKCTPGTRDWNELVRILRKAFIYRDMLMKEDPLYDTFPSIENGRGLPGERTRACGPIGTLRHCSSDTSYLPDIVRRIFTNHHILCVPASTGPRRSNLVSPSIVQRAFNIDPESPLTMHRMSNSRFAQVLVFLIQKCVVSRPG